MSVVTCHSTFWTHDCSIMTASFKSDQAVADLLLLIDLTSTCMDRAAANSCGYTLSFLHVCRV